MDVPVTGVEHVRDRWVNGDFPEFPDATLRLLIADAELMIGQEAPAVYESAMSGEASAVHRVISVTAAMVSRLLRNPTGQRSATEQTGPFSSTVTLAGDDLGELVLTDKDRRILRGEPSFRRAFTLAPGRGAR